MIRNAKLPLAAALTLYLGYLVWFNCPYAGGSDSSGYLNSARLLLAGELTLAPRVPEGFPAEKFSSQLLVPAGFTGSVVQASQAQFAPSYPPGLPLHLAALGKLLGLEHAALAVSLLAVLGLLGAGYSAARDAGVRAEWAITVVAVLALSPVTLFMAVQPMSDVLAAAWVAGAVVAARRSARDWRWSALTGLAVSVAVFVRPANALVMLPVAFLLGKSARAWLALALAALPGAVLWCVYHRYLYGSVFLTGYGSIGGQFAAAHVPRSLLHYAQWLPMAFTPLVLAALGLPGLKTVARREKWLLVLWAAPFFVFYAAYFFTTEAWWYLRFLLPATLPLLIAAAQVLQDFRWPVLAFNWEGPSSPRHRLPLITVAAVAASVWLLGWAWHFGVHTVELSERPYRKFGEWVEHSLPAGSLIAADQTSGAILFYSRRPFLRWDVINVRSYDVLNRLLAERGGQLYAGLFPFEEKAALTEHMPGTWERIAQYRAITIWRRVSLTPAALPPPR